MAYTNSSLVSYTKLSPNHSGQRTHSIDRITPHCVVGQCSVETLGKLNPDQEVVNTIREGLKRTGGYCPCRRERTEATKCMCQEFKNPIADPGFEGVCHCMLYYKSL